jgi:hypothetical protein
MTPATLPLCNLAFLKFMINGALQMKRMSTNEIRQYWLDYFGQHGHATVASSSLVPSATRPCC